MKIITVGKIVKTRGLKGEVKVYPLFDRLDKVFVVGNKLLTSTKQELIIKKVTINFDFSYLIFENYENIDLAEKLRGIELFFDGDKLPCSVDEYYDDDFIGLSVINEQSGEVLGEIYSLMKLHSNINLIFKYHGIDCYLPFIFGDFVKSVDKENKKIFIEVVEGLLP